MEAPPTTMPTGSIRPDITIRSNVAPVRAEKTKPMRKESGIERPTRSDERIPSVRTDRHGQHDRAHEVAFERADDFANQPGLIEENVGFDWLRPFRA